jgi:hypothetical protein
MTGSLSSDADCADFVIVARKNINRGNVPAFTVGPRTTTRWSVL